MSTLEPTRRDCGGPTEANAERGSASVCIGSKEIMLSEAVRWVEPNGDHVIRSVEFDVGVGAPTFEEALAKFTQTVIDFAAYLGEIGASDLADNEEEMFHRLAPRVIRVGFVRQIPTSIRSLYHALNSHASSNSSSSNSFRSSTRASTT